MVRAVFKGYARIFAQGSRDLDRMMRNFFWLSVGYLAVALAILGLLGHHPNELIGLTQTALVDKAQSAGVIAGVMLILPLALLAAVRGRRDLGPRLAAAGFAAAGAVMLQIGFSFMKCSIPALLPFYADPALARFDLALHGGTDPWRIAHALIAPTTGTALLPFYLEVWSAIAVGFPIFIAVLDSDRDRIRRFMTLYLIIWIGLGNILATLVSSAGPVFYDALLASDRFADLTGALQASGIRASFIGTVQAYLWMAYSTQQALFGSGISAFPSVHLAIATLGALYLWERSRWLAPVGVAFVAIIQFLSVYTGFHYAIDGYFSVLFVLVVWLGLRRFMSQSAAQQNVAAG